MHNFIRLQQFKDNSKFQQQQFRSKRLSNNKRQLILCNKQRHPNLQHENNELPINLINR